MWSIIANMFLGGIGTIAKEIRQANYDKLQAANDEQRIKADVKIESLQARRDVLVAEAKGAWNVLFRAVLALPFALFVWKVVVWDKLLGLGSTDDLSSDMWNLMMVVYGFYFVYETATLFKRSS